MKKKLLIVMFAQIVAIASAFALTACGETNGNGGSNTGNTGNGDNTDITTTFGSLLRNRPRTKILLKFLFVPMLHHKKEMHLCSASLFCGGDNRARTYDLLHVKQTL